MSTWWREEFLFGEGCSSGVWETEMGSRSEAPVWDPRDGVLIVCQKLNQFGDLVIIIDYYAEAVVQYS